MQCEIHGLFTALNLSVFVAAWALGGWLTIWTCRGLERWSRVRGLVKEGAGDGDGVSLDEESNVLIFIRF
jgi:hypothetical protein